MRQHEKEAKEGGNRSKVPPTVNRASPRGCMSKHSAAVRGLAIPGIPELPAYRKPVVMSHRNGGLALNGWFPRG